MRLKLALNISILIIKIINFINIYPLSRVRILEITLVDGVVLCLADGIFLS